MAAVRVMPKHVNRLLAVLAELAANWNLFMGQLDFPEARIKEIERDVPPGDRRSLECLRTALHQWISVSDNPTYGDIIAALKSPVLKEAVLARSVEAFSNNIECMFFCFFFLHIGGEGYIIDSRISMVIYIALRKFCPSYFFVYPADIGPGEIQFDVNMSAEELCELLKQKGVNEDDCALFRSKVHFG